MFDSDSARRMSELAQDLTESQLKFCEVYSLSGSVEVAAKAAHPERSLNQQLQIASEYLRSPSLIRYMELYEMVMKINKEPCLEEAIMGTARIARSNIADFLTEDGEIDLSNANRDQLYAVAEVNIEYVKGHKNFRIKMYNKQAALKDLGVHYGGFSVRNAKSTANSYEELLDLVAENDELAMAKGIASPSDPINVSAQADVIDAVVEEVEKRPVTKVDNKGLFD